VQYKSTNTTVYSAKHHIIWCPRDVVKRYVENQKVAA
jgi:REP element-mobilizing transposase RayT